MAQNEATVTREQMGGVYYAYHYSRPESPALVPPGFHPFYISHYGRHGSRWLPSDSRYTNVLKQFEDTANLTSLGKETRAKLLKIWDNARGNGGRLTPLGARQNREIAARMMDNYPSVFASGAVVDAKSSISDRCQASMFAFCDEVRNKSRVYIRMSLNVDSAFMKWIAYASPEQLRLEKTVGTPRKYSASRLMKTLFLAPSKVNAQEDLMSELHTIASSMQDVGLPISLYGLFTDAEFRQIYNHNNMQMTLHNGLSTGYEDICSRSAVSLWKNIESEADKTISSGGHGATLRFGHDTSLYRLLTLMNVDNTAWRDGKVDMMDRVVPMGANLQIVFYKSADDKIYVLILHNEQPVRLNGNFPGRIGMLYPWDEVKQHVRHRISEVGI